MTAHQWDWDKIRPGGIEFDRVGASFSGGRSISGIVHNMDYTTGGMWSIAYTGCQLFDPSRHLYWNKIAVRLSGNSNFLIVPILATFLNPYPSGNPPLDGEPVIDNDTQIDAEVYTAADANDGQLDIRVNIGNDLDEGHLFSIEHTNMNWRMYQIHSVLDIVSHTDFKVYTVKMLPTLREAVAGGEVVQMDWPRCTMKLSEGTTMSYGASGYWVAVRDVRFSEYFPTG